MRHRDLGAPGLPALRQGAAALAAVEPDYVQPKGTFPSISRMVGDQIGLSEEEKKAAEARTERAYKDGLWAPMS